MTPAFCHTPDLPSAGMRLLALLFARGIPVLGFALLIMFLFDIGGVQQPIGDAYISAATAVGELLGEQLKDALIPEPTPRPTPGS